MTSIPLLASTRPLPGAIIDARIWLTLARAGTVVFAAGLATLILLRRWEEVELPCYARRLWKSESLGNDEEMRV